LIDEVYIFVDDGYIGSSQRIGVGRGGDIEKVERAFPLLSPPGEACSDSRQKNRYISKRMCHNCFRVSKIAKIPGRQKVA